MKKFIIIVLAIIITFLLGLNIYIISSNNTISNNVDTLQTVKNEITLLESYSGNIVNLAHMQKSFLLTGDDKFKTQYSDSLSKAYEDIDTMLNQETITNSDKVELVNYLDDYNDLNNDIFNTNPSLPLSQENEDIVIKSDEIQNNMLRKISSLIAAKTDSSSENSSTISDSISSQNSIVKIISSFFTLGISGPIYYFVKKYKNGEISFNTIIDSINKEEEVIDNYSNILTYINVTNTLNLQLEKEWNEVSDLIINLQKSISEIKEQLSSITFQDKLIFEDKFKNIEIQLLEIKLLVKQLPDYHKFIVDLSQNLTKSEENKK